MPELIFMGVLPLFVSFSIDPDAYNNYGPFTPGFVVIPYNDAEALAKSAGRTSPCGRIPG